MCLGMDVITNNSFTKSEKSTLTRDAVGPKSSYKLHTSFDAANNYVGKRRDYIWACIDNHVWNMNVAQNHEK